MSARPQPDLLSEVLADLKLDSAFFFYAEFTAPWTVHSPPSCDYAPHLSSAASHLIIFHMLTSGSMYARLERGGTHVPLSPGDIVAFPHGDPHVLGNGPDIRPMEAGDTLAHVLARGLELAHFGGGGEPTGVVCGFMALDSRLGPAVLAGLPPMLKVSLRQDPSGHWLENSIRFSVSQAASTGAGSRAVLARLAETLFLETVRRYSRQSPENLSGLLAGVRDPAIAAALSLLHRRPTEDWTLASLARECGLSRSVLAARFKASLGQSPMAYLTRRRLHLAARLLASHHSSLAPSPQSAATNPSPPSTAPSSANSAFPPPATAPNRAARLSPSASACSRTRSPPRRS